MRRAERLTQSPSTEYSLRVVEPTTPQNAVPVVMPHDAERPSFSSAAQRLSDASTARSESFSCARGGRPQTAMRVDPLSSIRNLFTLPSYAYTAFCTAKSTSCARQRASWYVAAARRSWFFRPRLTKTTTTERSSLPQPSCFESPLSVPFTAPGRYMHTLSSTSGSDSSVFSMP
jgi:hypothetical protein